MSFSSIYVLLVYLFNIYLIPFCGQNKRIDLAKSNLLARRSRVVYILAVARASLAKYDAPDWI